MKRKVGIAIIMLISIGIIWAPKAFADLPPFECDFNESSQECYNAREKDNFCDITPGVRESDNEEERKAQEARNQDPYCGGSGVALDSFCRIKRSNPELYSKQDYKAQSERNEDPRCRGSGTVINNTCENPSSGCFKPYSIFKQSWFYVNLLLTLIIELIIVLLLIRPVSRRKVMTVILVNIASYVPFIILLTSIVNYLSREGIRDIYWPIVAIGEVGVIIFEALIFKKVLKLNTKKAFAVSIIANTMSAVVGYFISVVLLR